MSSPETKTVTAEVEFDGDRKGTYMGARANMNSNSHDNASPHWGHEAETILATLAASGEPFGADDLRRAGLGEPEHPSQWGALFKRAQTEGVIVSVGVINSQRAQRHGSLTRVWVGAHGEGIAA